MAAPVSESVAMQEAQAFLASRGKMVAGMTMAPSRRGMETNAPYYAFNVGNDGGFVLVSGDDSVEPILGYADEGYIDMNDLPDGLQYLLECYAAEAGQRSKVKGQRQCQSQMQSQRSSATVRRAIAPMIETKWNQSAPYNNFTPYYQAADKHAPTGCVATAIAQVMKYWEWPQAACTALPGYRPIDDPNDTVAPLPATTFDWANMLATYTGNESEAENDAVATLMEYCGKAMQMRYRSTSSSARSIGLSYVLKTYFDYDPGVHYVYRAHYSYTEWVELLYSELAAGRPLCISGQSAGSGHSFVCDGYDADDYFHINWGWSGKSDGYFRLVNLNPHDQGIGGTSTDDGYSMDVGATIGIQPSTQATGKDYCLLLSETTFYRTGGHQAFRWLVRSIKNGTNAFDVNLRLYNTDGTLYRDVWTWDSTVIKCYNGRYLSYHFYDDNVPDGTYLVKPFSRLHGETEWKECMDWESQQLTLTVTNGHDTTTMAHPQGIVPMFATLSVSGSQKVGGRVTVTAHVTGGEADYNGNLILYVNHKEKMGLQADIPAGGARDVVFWYNPSVAGNDTLALYADESFTDQIGNDTIIVIQGGSVTSECVALDKRIVMHNTQGTNRLYGGHVQATVVYTNPSADTTYYGFMQITLFEKLPGSTSFPGTILINKRITVAPLDSVVFEIDEAGKVKDAKYALRAHIRRDTIGGYQWTSVTSKTYTMNAGYELFAADGSSTLHPLGNTQHMGDAAFADLSMLTGAESVNRIFPSSNPNCVYLLNDTANVSWSAGLGNIVRGGLADSITLTDGYAFYTPVAFTATSIKYKRPFTAGASSICLPFDVVQVPGGVLAFSDEVAGDVVFSGVYHRMDANTPYLFIGDRNSMVDSMLVFAGSNAKIEPSQVFTLSGNHYAFSGCTYVVALEDVYVEDGGSGFTHQNQVQSVPFRAWFRDSEIEPYPVEMLDLHLLPTGVEELRTKNLELRTEKFIRDGRLYIRRDGVVYDVTGNKVSTK